MKINKCRSCKSKQLKQAFSLGEQFLTGIFPKNKNEHVTKGHLSMVICNISSPTLLGLFDFGYFNNSTLSLY